MTCAALEFLQQFMTTPLSHLRMGNPLLMKC